MKKIAKILFGMITVFILCITSLNFSEASVKQDQKNATKKYYDLMKNGSGDYKIVDINGDKYYGIYYVNDGIVGDYRYCVSISTGEVFFQDVVNLESLTPIDEYLQN